MQTAVIEQTAIVVNRTRCFHVHFHAICNKVGNRNAELYLIGNEWLADIFLQQCNLHRLVVGNTEMADLSALKQNIKGGSYIFWFYERIRPVEQQKIEVIRLQTF